MARNARVDVGDTVYHVLNRAVGRLRIFTTADDYRDFLIILEEAREKTDMRVLAFVIMPNHWHLVVYPRNNKDMGLFMHQLTNVHTRRVHAKTETTGTGPLYQGRYKSFPIEDDAHLLTVLKYVERNPVRAKLVKKCEEWRWGSAWLRSQSSELRKRFIDDPPLELPKNYRTWINARENEESVEQLRNSVRRGTPFGSDVWVENMIKKHELISTVRKPGRPALTTTK